jgi:hypothetical protein
MMADDFKEWVQRGPGEAMLGGALKAAATSVKKRLQKKLETPNLFPHIEHEDRAEIEKADQAWQRGDKMVKRCKARTTAIKELLDADAGLRITDDDLKPTGGGQ